MKRKRSYWIAIFYRGERIHTLSSPLFSSKEEIALWIKDYVVLDLLPEKKVWLIKTQPI